MASGKKYLIKLFILPITGFGLFISLACFFAWNNQAELQRKDFTIQVLQNLELSLAQLKEGLSRSESEQLKVYLNLSEYFLEKASGEGTGRNIKDNPAKPFLLEVKNAQEHIKKKLSGPGTGKDVWKAEEKELEDILGQSGELIRSINKSRDTQIREVQIFVFAGLAAFISLFVFLFRQFRNYIWLPVKGLGRQSVALVEGKDQEVLSGTGNFLFSHISGNMCLHQEHLNKLAQMADQIGDGNFGQKPEDFESAGALGKSIGRMREKIQASFKDEEKRSWASEGITQFSELVREYNGDVNFSGPRLLSQLVPFVKASQGAFFIAEQSGGELSLNLVASYAWGRQKHIYKSFLPGEGILGQVALDKEMIMLTEVPDDFISIGSGLGKAKPGCILILPLLAGGELFGVLELASFQVFEEYQILFLQKLSEVLASSIAMANGSNKTKDLLRKAEEANVQLIAQEEELRQNTEELLATQEAMRRKEVELEKLQEGLEIKLREATLEMKRQIQEIEGEKTKNGAILEGCVDGVISFDVEGKIGYFNKAAEEIWEVSRQDAMGKHIRDFIPVEILIVDGELLVYYAKNGGRKILDARTEVPVIGRSGQEMEVLLTLTRVKVEGTYTFTAFAQKVAVELF